MDATIRSGDFARGLELCRAGARAAPDPQNRYRTGLCLEGLGRTADAVKEYHAAAKADGPVAVWAELGLVRCAMLEGETDTAAAALNRLVLLSGRTGADDMGFIDECLHVRGALAVQELGPAPGPTPFDAAAVAWPPTDRTKYTVDQLLPARIAHRANHDAHEEHAGLTVVRGDAATPADLWRVGGLEPAMPPVDAVRALTRAASLTLVIDPAVEQSDGVVPVRLHTSGVPLGEVLDAVTTPAGLGWRVDGTVLTLRPADPINWTAGLAQAADKLRRAAAAAPSHPRNRAAAVELANIAYELGRRRPPAQAYRQVLEETPHNVAAVYAAHNLGLIDLRAGNLAVARNRFLELVDRDPSGPWGQRGWWWAGRADLDGGDLESAIKCFQTARQGPDETLRRVANLETAVCHLLAGRTREAGTVFRGIYDYREGPSGAAAEMIDAILRFRTAPSAGRADRVGRALAAAGNGDPLGPAAVFLAGQVYSEAGSPDRAAALYEAAAERFVGPYAVLMTFLVAERAFELGQSEKARPLYRAVAAAGGQKLATRAELRLAELAVRGGVGEDCVRICRRLLDRPGGERAEVFALLGRGYELRGQPRLAALAYLGRLPED